MQWKTFIDGYIPIISHEFYPIPGHLFGGFSKFAIGT
jgi:hypothetical protein